MGICALLLAWMGGMGCGPRRISEPGLVRLSPKQSRSLFASMHPRHQGLTSWTDLMQPVQRSLEALEARNGSLRVASLLEQEVSVHDLRVTLRHFLRLLPRLKNTPALLAQEFAGYALRPKPLFTGYFEPELEASLDKRAGYAHPLYAPPSDLQKVDLGRFHPRWEGERLVYRLQEGRICPYHTREEIEAKGALQGKAEVVAWARDPVDVFFLHIQGSGQLLLPGGDRAFVGYAGKNGRAYVSLGRVLVDRGYMTYDQLSMQSIRSYLHTHPQLIPEILFTNPSYVFFEIRENGPYGALGKKLTPMVSLATDPSVLPLGGLLAMQVDLPGDSGRDTFSGFGLAQDVGGAIQGRHVDLYCGSGERAGRIAGRLKTTGGLYLILSREVLEQGNERR